MNFSGYVHLLEVHMGNTSRTSKTYQNGVFSSWVFGYDSV